MTKKIYLSAIAAVAKNNVIGRDNRLIWHIPEDLKFFKRTTMGKPILMGRKSYESLGKPLPGRPNIVISRSYGDAPAAAATDLFWEMEEAAPAVSRAEEANRTPEGPFLYASIAEGIAAAKNMAQRMGVAEVFITGGGEIYKQTMGMIDRLYLTRVERDYEGDVYFPDLNPHEWHTVSKESHEGDPAFTFYVMERKNNQTA